MSTRSFIARQIDDDTYRTIYCHMDGYLTYNGALLLDCYNTPEKVDELLNLGDLSFLTSKLNPDPSKPHAFDYDMRQEGVTVAYGRDRGEKNTGAVDLPMEYLQRNARVMAYCYVFTKDNEWKYFKGGMSDKTLKDVKTDVDREYSKYGISQRPEGYYGFLNEEIAESMKAEMNESTADIQDDINLETIEHS